MSFGRLSDFHVGSSPVPFIEQASRAYRRQTGLGDPLSRHEDYSRVVMPESRSRMLSDAYRRLPEFDHGAIKSFRAMAEETKRQYEFMSGPVSKGGMGIDIEVTKEDPYGGNGAMDIFKEMRHDVTENNRMRVMSTRSTGGHPLFSDDENDMFRGVHDVFGHLGSGRGVDFNGEEAAFQKHSSMFSPLARAALSTETRGQNSALRTSGEFQDQKVALMPAHMQTKQFTNLAPVEERLKAVTMARFKNAQQGIG